ncbi:MAG: hypothetical protein U0793_12735 [Gemmataceae bacterium]
MLTFTAYDATRGEPPAELTWLADLLGNPKADPVIIAAKLGVIYSELNLSADFWRYYAKCIYRRWQGADARHFLVVESKRVGRHPVATRASTLAIKLLLDSASPSQCGYDDGHWTVRLLLDVLLRGFNLDIADSTLRRMLHNVGYEWNGKKFGRRPAYKTTAGMQDAIYGEEFAKVHSLNLKAVLDCVNQEPCFISSRLQMPEYDSTVPEEVNDWWYVRFKDRLGQRCTLRLKKSHVRARVRQGKIPKDAEACKSHNGIYVLLANVPELSTDNAI